MFPSRFQVLAIAISLAVGAIYFFQHPLSAQATQVRSAVQQTALGPPLNPPLSLARSFRAPLTQYGAGHRGIDLVVSDGDAVLSPASGTISFSGLVATKPVLSLQTPAGLTLSFEPACGLPVGTTVFMGQALGVICLSGYASHCLPANCLHFSARNGDGYLSPQYLLGQLGPSHLTS